MLLSGAFGPLAVTDQDTQAISAASVGQGLLSIGDRCVTLDLDAGRSVTLAFRAKQVEWDDVRSEISFRDPFDGTLVLKSGDRIDVGGEGIGPSQGGEPAHTRRWISAPDPSCPKEVFEVHTLDLLQATVVVGGWH